MKRLHVHVKVERSITVDPVLFDAVRGRADRRQRRLCEMDARSVLSVQPSRPKTPPAAITSPTSSGSPIRRACRGKPSLPTAKAPSTAKARSTTEARIEKRGVDAVGIHVGDALVRVKATGLAVLVGHRVGLDDALPCADRADAVDADLVLLDDQPLVAIFAFDDLRRLAAEFRINVFYPEVERLQDVAVGINDVIGATHALLLGPFNQRAQQAVAGSGVKSFAAATQHAASFASRSLSSEPWA